MALTYNQTTRDLSIKGQITFADGTIEWVTVDDIISYSFDQQIGSEGLPLGSAEAASFNLEINNVGRKYTPEKFDNAEIHMFCGLRDGDNYAWSDFGVWYVDGADAPEQSVSITLTGFDALATRFEASFTDSGKYPTTIGTLAQTICTAAGISLKRTDFPNAAVSISKKPKWEEETTLRDVLSYIAIAAAGYVRIERNGKLNIVSFAEGEEHELSAELYTAFSLTSGTAFSFNCIEAKTSSDADDYTRFAVDSSIKSSATNTIQIDWNPLLTKNIVNSIVTELTGISMTSATVEWGGDPAVMCCDRYAITRLDGGTTRMMITGQSYTFDGGLSVSEHCNMPSINTTSSETYSTSTNMYDSNGNLNATRISGLDKSVIVATAAHFESLTSGTIETDRLVTAYLSALELAAKSINTESVETNTLTATIAAIAQATIDKITAGTITTDALYAALAEVVALKVGTLTAEDIKTDSLAAALAAFTVITAGTAEFDRATVAHLVAEALNLQFGVADQVYIKNLAVEYAQMVGAAIGNLCIRASDGNYYAIDVDEDGNVIANVTEVSEDEIEAGQTDGGRVLLETSITAQSLNTSNLLATYALINQIDAARIDVDVLLAREAFITKLITSHIFSNGSSLEIVAAATDEMQKWFKFTNDRGLIIRKPEYTDASGVVHPASIWYTVTDEVGYHIYNTQQTAPVGSFQRGGLNTTGVTIGDIACKRTTSGGWVWTDTD